MGFLVIVLHIVMALLCCFLITPWQVKSFCPNTLLLLATHPLLGSPAVQLCYNKFCGLPLPADGPCSLSKLHINLTMIAARPFSGESSPLRLGSLVLAISHALTASLLYSPGPDIVGAGASTSSMSEPMLSSAFEFHQGPGISLA